VCVGAIGSSSDSLLPVQDRSHSSSTCFINSSVNLCLLTELSMLTELSTVAHHSSALAYSNNRLCRMLLYRQVLIFSLLPPPGSPQLQPDERGAAWGARSLISCLLS
jgi:hypothetical protein